jgi:gluconokinase
MLVLIMGVAGCGKTTIGSRLASLLGWAFADADDLHSAESVQKMASGVPLTDDDRRPWLQELHTLVASHAAKGDNLVLACSALKESYRALLSSANPRCTTVYLKADEALIRERLPIRRGHYMPAALLQSQFEALEEPVEAITISAALPPDQIVAALRQSLGV